MVAPSTNPASDSQALSAPESPPADLIASLVLANFDLAKVAAERGRPIADILAWLSVPTIQKAAAELLTTSQLFLEIKLAQARMEAIDTLKDIAHHGDNLTERRRAATSLVRRFDRGGFAVAHHASAPSSEWLQSAPTAEPAPSNAAAHPRPLHPVQKSDQKEPGPFHIPPSRALAIAAFADRDDAEPQPPMPGPVPRPGPGPDAPSRLAEVVFNAFARRSAPRLASIILHHATSSATLDGRPLRTALDTHTLASMPHAREIAYIEQSRSDNQATYTFSFVKGLFRPVRAAFRFLFTRAGSDTWLIHQIETLDTS